MAYLGFSLPVVVTGVLIDAFGQAITLGCFGMVVAIGSTGLGVSLQHRRGRLIE